HTEELAFQVTDIGNNNLILGIKWLCRHNPTINWDCYTMDFESDFCRSNCTLRPTPSPTPKTTPLTYSYYPTGYW
ncbi:hypothetical protein BDV98DRAFT_516828, partial [Pterulicium gracile]